MLGEKISIEKEVAGSSWPTWRRESMVVASAEVAFWMIEFERRFVGGGNTGSSSGQFMRAQEKGRRSRTEKSRLLIESFMMTTSNCQVPCAEVKDLSLLTTSSIHIAICEVSKKFWHGIS